MSIKKSVIIVSFIIILLCSVNSIFAVNDNTSTNIDNIQIDNNNLEDNFDVSSDNNPDDNSINKIDGGSLDESGFLKDSDNKNILHSTSVANYEELADSLNNGGTVILTNNITVKDSLIISVNNTVIDGAGYTINGDNKHQIFNVNANNAVIKNLNFINGNSSNGGAVYFAGGNGLVANCTFINSYAFYGGAVYFAGGNGLVANCTFTGNNANIDGGGLCLIGSYGTVSNCTFISNRAYSQSSDGGALCLSGKYNTAVNCTFINNTAYYGGAVLSHETDAFINNCTFINNTGERGALMCDSNVTVVNSKFINNTGVQTGAILWNNENGINGVVDNCIFINNSGTYSGAVEWLAARGTVKNSLFINNSGTYAGAVFWSSNPGNDGLVKNCTFISNTGSYGGVMVWYGVNGIIDNCSLINNTGVYSGGIYWRGSEGIINATNFISNRGSYGGALFWVGTSGLVNNSNMVYNRANTGSGICLNANNMTVANTVLLNNTADSDELTLEFNSTARHASSTLYGNDNLFNGIYSSRNLTAYNVTYYDVDGVTNTGSSSRTYVPDDGNEKGMNITFIVVRKSDNKVVINITNITNEEGTAFFSFDNYILSSDDYNISAVHEEDLYYTYIRSSPDNFTVILKNTTTNVNPMNITYGETEFINIKVNADDNVSNITGNVSVNINGTDYTLNLTNATANLSLYGLNSGTYNVTVRYNGDLNYEPSNASATFTVFKANSTVVVVVDNVTYPGDVVVDVSLGGVGGVGLNGTVVVAVGGSDYNLTVVDGVGSFVVGGLDAGDYAADAVFAGNDNYNPSGNSTVFNVAKANSIVSVSVEDIDYLDTAIVNVNLTGVNDIALNGTVVVTVDNKNYNVSVIDGIGYINIQELNAGNYTVNASFAGNNNYNPSFNSTTFIVNKLPTNITITVENTTYPGNLTINFTLLDINNNQLVGNHTHTVTILNNTYNLTVVDGKSFIVLNNLKPDNYTVFADYAGSLNYISSNNINTFTVFKRPTQINITPYTKGNKADLTVILSEKIDGNVTVNVNNENYTVDIKNGTGFLTIYNLSPGRYNVTVNYDGSDYYFESNNLSSFIINKTANNTGNHSNYTNKSDNNNTYNTNSNPIGSDINNNYNSGSSGFSDIDYSESAPETGNPLYILLVSLLILCIMPFRYKK